MGLGRLVWARKETLVVRIVWDAGISRVVVAMLC